MKVLKRIILITILAIAVLSLGAYLAIKLTFPPAKIKELVHKHGSEALNRDVSVEDVSIRVFPNLKLSISEIKIANAQGFSNESLFKLRELALSIDFISLLKFSPVVNEIKLVDPEILYEVSADGHNNLEGIGKGDSTITTSPVKDSTKPLVSPAAIALKSFIITDGVVRYHDLKSGRNLVLNKINQAVSLDLDQKLENINTKGKLEIAGIQVSDSASGVTTGNIRVTVKHDIHLNLPGEKLQVRTLELGFQDISIAVKGEATRFMTKSPSFDFSASGSEIKLASLLKEVPRTLSPDIAKLSVSGIANFDAHLKGILDSTHKPVMTAHFGIKEAAVSHKDLPAGVEKLNLQLTLDADSLLLQTLAFSLGGNPVTMHAKVLSLLSPIPFLDGFDLNALVDLGKVIPLAQKLGLADKQMKAEGNIHATVNASGPLDPKAPQNLKAQGVIEFKSLTMSGKPLPQPLKLNGIVKIENEKISENLAVHFGESDFSIIGTVINYLAMVMPKAAVGQTTKAKLAIQSNFLNLDELLPTEPKPKEKPSEPIKAFPALPKVEADVDIKLAKTQLMNLSMTQFSSHTNLSGGIVLTSLKGSLYSGGFSSTLRADLKDTTDAGITLKLDVAKVEANDFISRLNDRLPTSNRLMKSLSNTDSTLYGKFNLNVDVKTHGLPQTMADNLTGKINFSLLDGKLRETGMVKGLSDALGKVSKSLAFNDLTFSDFKTEMEAANGKLLVKDCRINESVIGSVIATGSIGFDNSLALNLENHLPAKLSGALTGAGSALASSVAKLSGVPALGSVSLVPTDKAGRAIVYFLIGGLLTQPSFALDSKRMAAEASSGAKSAIADALDKKKQEIGATLNAEKAKLENEAKARLDAEKKKLQQQADEQKSKATDQAKQQGKKLLKGIGL